MAITFRSRLPSTSFARRRAQLAGATALLIVALAGNPVAAQGLQPGEAFATRFSGVAQGTGGAAVIDVHGTVGSILDLRTPRQPAHGQRWIDEPQRAPVTAAQVGQVFGVAFDDATPPNIYVTATAAFGLHRSADNAGWMAGMFGAGGPGAIYKLEAANGYQPRLFATVTLDGRPNSGAALGNIAFDRWNKQFLVSDLETGMIHRIGLDGRDLGRYDHGTEGRARFLDAASGRDQSLAPIAFDPASQAKTIDCHGRFDTTPECWNVAASNRRVWGLGVWRGPNQETRLYYAVASGPDLGNDTWAQLADDERRNTLWSVRLGAGGAFDTSSVRREFLLPDFFASPTDIARAGFSRPVSDITFPACSGRAVMLVAERGGLRNLGLGQENAFATPHEARTIRYELDQSGTWRVMGRYDIGMYDRSREGAPAIHANCAGGASFGPGYTADGRAATGQPDEFVWIAGDRLCSPEGPCVAPGSHQPMVRQVAARSGQDDYQPDESQVHGVQGQPEAMYNALIPGAASEDPQSAAPSAIGPGQAYMVDLDINVDRAGRPIAAEMARNDATTIGDISVYQLCPVESAAYSAAYPLMAIPVGIIHGRGVSHWRYHSHSRWASHDRRWSAGHHRWWSEGHWRYLSPAHHRELSPTHWRRSSPGHWRRLSPSHQRDLSPNHSRRLSPTHNRYLSPTHQRGMSPSHSRTLSPTHERGLSPTHTSALSPGHSRNLSPQHSKTMSPGHSRSLSPQHSKTMSPGTPEPVPNNHLRVLSVNQGKNQPKTHQRGISVGQHATALSKANQPKLQPKHTSPKRHPGGMAGGMSGGMVQPKGLNRPVAPRPMQKSTPQRIGPQMFRGGSTLVRR